MKFKCKHDQYNAISSWYLGKPQAPSIGNFTFIYVKKIENEKRDLSIFSVFSSIFREIFFRGFVFWLSKSRCPGGDFVPGNFFLTSQILGSFRGFGVPARPVQNLQAISYHEGINPHDGAKLSEHNANEQGRHKNSSVFFVVRNQQLTL